MPSRFYQSRAVSPPKLQEVSAPWQMSSSALTEAGHNQRRIASVAAWRPPPESLLAPRRQAEATLWKKAAWRSIAPAAAPEREKVGAWPRYPVVARPRYQAGAVRRLREAGEQRPGRVAEEAMRQVEAAGMPAAEEAAMPPAEGEKTPRAKEAVRAAVMAGAKKETVVGPRETMGTAAAEKRTTRGKEEGRTRSREQEEAANRRSRRAEAWCLSRCLLHRRPRRWRRNRHRDHRLWPGAEFSLCAALAIRGRLPPPPPPPRIRARHEPRRAVA